MDWIQKKEELEDLILVKHFSYEAIGRMYNISGAGVKKIALSLGIKLEQRRIINQKETFGKGVSKVPTGRCPNCNKEVKLYASRMSTFCSFKCQHEYHHKLKYQKLIEGDPSIMRATYSPVPFKKDILEEQGGVCAICGCKPEHNNKPLVFILDHIDGHASNNKRDNLRMICPNCDSQLDTYKSKNKHGDREYHRLNHR